jgi:hypothetical protein
MTMQRREREDLEKMCRDRERLAKAACDARASDLKANFEQQMAATYSFDSDEVWKKAAEMADKTVKEANIAIAAQCEQLGIPKEFAPQLNLAWYSRGENASKERRVELRKVAYTRIDAQVKDAKATIALTSCDYRVKLISGSLESDEARAFLEQMPTVVDLMPKFTLAQIEDAERRHSRRRYLSV